MRRQTPMGALGRGLAAGVAGSWALSQYFKITSRLHLVPQTPPESFQPPEPEQKSEGATATVARRVTEGLAKRGPLDPEEKQVGGQIVHYAFGAGWGGLYALLLESVPRPAGGLAGALAFGSTVWMVSDNALLPAFRLGATPRAYPLPVHANALAGHLVYGLATWGAWRLLGPATWSALGAGVWALSARRRARRVPGRLKPAVRNGLLAYAAAKAVLRPRARAVMEAVR